MHNIGRTVRETYETAQGTAYEFEEEFQNEFESSFEAGTQQGYEMAGSQEFNQEYEQEYAQEFQGEWTGEFEMQGMATEEESPFNEMQEMELATELLEVQNEAELDQFIGKLMGRAGKGGGGGFLKSNAGRALGGILKKVAAKALPIAGRIAGGFFGGPVGAQIGGKIGSFASKAFGLEMEGMSHEDREFATSRAYVRFAGLAARRAASNRYWRSRPRNVIRHAVVGAAQRYAPGLLLPAPVVYQDNYDDGVYDVNNFGTASTTPPQSGVWVRREGRIIVQGI